MQLSFSENCRGEVTKIGALFRISIAHSHALRTRKVRIRGEAFSGSHIVGERGMRTMPNGFPTRLFGGEGVTPLFSGSVRGR
jgi:hypothetical protein